MGSSHSKGYPSSYPSSYGTSNSYDSGGPPGGSGPHVHSAQNTNHEQAMRLRNSNLAMYLETRIGDTVTGGVAVADGDLAAVAKEKNYSDMVRILAMRNGLVSGDGMPCAVVLMLTSNDKFTMPIRKTSTVGIVGTDDDSVSTSAIASMVEHQMIGWSSMGEDQQAAAVQILKEIMQEIPVANELRNNVYIVRIASDANETVTNFVSYGWMNSRLPFHISIEGGGNKANIVQNNSGGSTLVLPLSDILHTSMTLACFAEDTLIKGVGWCGSCSESGLNVNDSQFNQILETFQAKIKYDSEEAGIESSGSSAMTVYKFTCPSVEIAPGEAVASANKTCRSIGILVRRATSDRAAQYYTMVEGGSYYTTAAILKVASEQCAALNWNWPGSSVPIVPNGIYNKPTSYAAVSLDYESKNVKGMDQVLANMEGVQEPCTQINSMDTIMSLAHLLFKKGFTFDKEPLNLASDTQESVLASSEASPSSIITPEIRSAATAIQNSM